MKASSHGYVSFQNSSLMYDVWFSKVFDSRNSNFRQDIFCFCVSFRVHFHTVKASLKHPFFIIRPYVFSEPIKKQHITVVVALQCLKPRQVAFLLLLFFHSCPGDGKPSGSNKNHYISLACLNLFQCLPHASDKTFLFTHGHQYSLLTIQLHLYHQQ